jgi:PilZ domain
MPLSSFFTPAYICKMPKPIKHLEREVRRARHLSAWIKEQDRTIAECQVMDISNNGAKIVTATSSVVPDRFQLAFFQGDQTRTCEVIWRHGKVFGVKFAR